MKWIFVYCLTFLCIGNLGFAVEIGLPDYIQQMERNDATLRSLILQRDGAKGAIEAADLPLEPTVFAKSSYIEDRRPTTNPSAQGTETDSQTFSLGLQQVSPYGAKWSLSENLAHNHTYGANSSFLPLSNFYDAYPKVDVTFSLWRNFLGREVRAERQSQKLGLELTSQKIDLDSTRRLVDAEVIFYTYWAQEEIVKIKRDSVQQAERLRKWAQDLRQKNLADKSDVFQADAAVLGRKLDLQNAILDRNEAARSFNRLRKVESTEVAESIAVQPLSFTDFDKDRNKEQRIRKDWKLQQTNSDAQFSQISAAREKVRPTLDFNLTAASLGRGSSFSDANSKTFDNNMYWQASVVFEVPLDQFKFYRVRDALETQKSAQEFSNVAVAETNADQWKQYLDKGNQLIVQLELMRSLESAQKNKAEAEQEKYNRGRSTTFQVISFQQDYFDARTRRIQLELQARSFLSQLKLFE